MKNHTATLRKHSSILMRIKELQEIYNL